MKGDLNLIKKFTDNTTATVTEETTIKNETEHNDVVEEKKTDDGGIQSEKEYRIKDDMDNYVPTPGGPEIEEEKGTTKLLLLFFFFNFVLFFSFIKCSFKKELYCYWYLKTSAKGLGHVGFWWKKLLKF